MSSLSAKKLKSIFQSQIFGAILGVVASVLLWIILCDMGGIVGRHLQLTNDFIRATDKLIQNHVRAWGEAPATMNELRLFARQTYNRYSAYDAWGERLEYMRLAKINYTLRSFGADGVQNKPGDNPDPGVFRWGPLEEHGLQYDSVAGNMQSRPSIVLFAGADDSSGKWYAKLFVDSVSGSRRLLVRNREESKFYMLAPHDGVEEFLWIPEQEKIIFTASQSARYADGVYVWDLKTDESTNLLDFSGNGSDLDPGRRQKRLHLALSSVNGGAPARIGAYIQNYQSELLNPQEFFRVENLHFFELDQKIRHIRPEFSPTTTESHFNLDFLGTSSVIDRGGGGSALQRSWLKLPMGGDWHKAVLAWQEFTAAHGKSPLAPYAVWALALFYTEASKSASGANAQIFASYSIELGKALTQMPASPGYIRSIGAWMVAKQSVK
jgi:hypothetical protein